MTFLETVLAAVLATVVAGLIGNSLRDKNWRKKKGGFDENYT